VSEGAAASAGGPTLVEVKPRNLNRRSVERLNVRIARRVDIAWCAAVLIGIALLFLLLELVPGASVPLLVGWAGAYALNPFVTLLEEKGLPRVLGTSLVFLIGTLLLVSTLLYLVPVIRDEVIKLPGFLRDGVTQVAPKLEAILGQGLPEFITERAETLRANLAEIFEKAGPIAAQVLSSVAGSTAKWVAALVGITLVPVLLFLLLLDFNGMHETVLGLVPRPAVGLVTRRFRQVDEVLGAFVRGQLVVGSILSLIYSAGLSIARIDLAIAIGIIAGFGNMVPYLGTGIGIVLAALGTLLAWQGPWQILAVALTFIVGQMLEGFVITPRVVGDRVGLSAMTIIVAILIFSELFGFVGILLAVPISAVLKVVVEVAVERYTETRTYRGPSFSEASDGTEALEARADAAEG
jgi:predicted PurR-regulated permease PerM